MRIACVLIPHFPAAVERWRDPALRGRPLVIGETPDQRKAVLDCSPEAEAQGVRAGMPLRQALAVCREAVFLPPHPSRYSDVFDSVLVVLEDFSPEVEQTSLGRAYLNAGGLARHYEGELDLGERIIRSLQEATGLVAGVGVAEGKFVAWAAAVTSEPGQVCTVPAGKESEFLRPLDVSLLPASPDTLRRLDLYGLRSMGDLASLSPGPLQAQFGGEGMRLWELARGVDSEPLRPRHREEVMSETLRFPTVAVSVEALVVACRRLLVRLHWRLHGRAARRLRLRAALWGGRSWEKTLTFHEAVTDWERMLFIAKSVLANAALPAPVEELTIELSGITEERGRQSTLFAEKAGLRRQLGETVRQLRARWGRPLVSRVVEVEPWSRLPERRHALIDYEP
ncbi:MAG: DNA polymerase Y family protein [Dehalococcoidia bacterium]|nr:DNA polymerase Y family protein [Dehalococcoidia bacterium]